MLEKVDEWSQNEARRGRKMLIDVLSGYTPFHDQSSFCGSVRAVVDYMDYGKQKSSHSNMAPFVTFVCIFSAKFWAGSLQFVMANFWLKPFIMTEQVNKV